MKTARTVAMLLSMASLSAVGQGLIFDEDVSGSDLVRELDTSDGSEIRRYYGPNDVEGMAPGVVPATLMADASARRIDTFEALMLAQGEGGSLNRGVLFALGDVVHYFEDGQNVGKVWSASGEPSPYSGLLVSNNEAGVGGDIQPSTGYLFALQSYGTSTILIHDLETGSLVDTLASDVTDLQALSFAADGTLYAVTRNSESLYLLDPTTGSGTLVGASGAVGMRLSGLEYVDAANTLYGTTSGNSDYPQILVTIDTVSGEVTPLTDAGSSYTKVQALTSNASGQLYTMARVDTIDQQDGQTDQISFLGLVSIDGASFSVSGPVQQVTPYYYIGQANMWPTSDGLIALSGDSWSGKLLKLDPGDGTIVSGETRSYGVGGDVQPNTDYLYSLSGYGTNTIYVHNPDTGALIDTIASDVGDLQALTFAADGTLYAVSRNSQSLYTLDTTSGVGTLIGASGALGMRLSGLEYLDSTGVLYGTTSGSSPYPQSIVTIDTNDASVSLLAQPAVGAVRNITSLDGALFAFLGSDLTIGETATIAGSLGLVDTETGAISRLLGGPVPGFGQQRGNLWVDAEDNIRFSNDDTNRPWGGIYSTTSGDLVENHALAIGTVGGDAQPGTNNLYSLDSYGTNTIYVHNPDTGALIDTITSDVGDLQALTFAADGTLYAVSRNSQSLYTLDTTSGVGTLIGASGALGMRLSGLEYLDSTGVLYGTTSGNSPYPQSFVEVNTTDGTVTQVSGPFGNANVRNLTSDSSGTLWAFTGGSNDYQVCYPAIFDPSAGTLTYADGSPVGGAGASGFPITNDSYEALASSVSRGRIYASDANEIIDMFGLEDGSYVGTLTASSNCDIESMAVDESSGQLYLGCDGSDDIEVIDLENGTVSLFSENPFDLDDGGMAIDSDGGYLYFVEESGEVHKMLLSDGSHELLIDLEFDDSTSEVGATFIDHFIGDPAVRVDTDGDGKADRYEEGYSAADTSVELDAYPIDPNDQVALSVAEDSGWRITTQRMVSPTDVPDEYELITDMIEFCAVKDSGPTGESMIAELQFNNVAGVADAIWMKRTYSGTWYEYENVSFSGDTAYVTLTDGGTGDADLIANNQICDPIGPVRQVVATAVPSIPVPAVPWWALLAGIFALIALPWRAHWVTR